MGKFIGVVSGVSLLLLSVISLEAKATPGGVDPTALKLWLDASDIDGDGDSSNNPAHGAGVVSWVDKSGSGYNATPVSSQATFDSSSAEAINGLPAVRFTNSHRHRINRWIAGVCVEAWECQDLLHACQPEVREQGRTQIPGTGNEHVSHC